MTQTTVRPLDFAAVDDLAFAVERGKLDLSRLPFVFEGRELGPLLELQQLSSSGCGPASLSGGWLDLGAFPGFENSVAAKGARWSEGGERRYGVLRTGRGDPLTEFRAFAIDAKRAAVSSGLAEPWAAEMIGALMEFHSNIYEHSEAQATGLVAYRATPGVFEFVCRDQGVGLLATLREAPEYGDLSSHGDALRLALTDGASRHGSDQDRGHGFRPLFKGLANRHARLRFRTGDASLVIDGTTPSLMRAQAGRKARIDGFFISVTCRVAPPGR